MNLLNKISEVMAKIRSIDSDTKKQLGLISIVLFCLFFSYPIVRSTVDATFLDIYGADKSPHVWIYSVLFLSIIVSIYNLLYKVMKVQLLFFFTSIFTVFSMFTCIYLVKNGVDIAAYFLYIIKEAYIVLLFHMALGWLNTALSFDMAKVLYGPIGAVNSISGIIGGYMTSALTYEMDTNQIMMVGVSSLIIAAFAFLKLSDVGSIKVEVEDEKKESPFASVAKVKKYLFWLGLIVMLTQFCISMANFKFFVLLEQFVSNKLEKTRYLGNIYSTINVISLTIQILVLPIAFRIFKNRSIHLFIPVFYMLVSVFGFFAGGSFLLPVATAFVVFKGFDYSVFSAAKELLYFPLSSKQKYGAKYIIDMVVYRFGKGLISFLLGLALVKANINFLLIFFLIIWFLALFPLFKEMKTLTTHNMEKL
ncbi:MAG: hypothetical protein KAG61_06865 [Bacteriovoracaceae bacterium]|nr:hypothetical protein [Bacteriovoracaceae bacterium]